MNRCFVFQAALSAALLGACTPVFAFQSAAERAPAQVPQDESPWVYLGPQRAQVQRLAISALEPDRMMALLGWEFGTAVSGMVFASEGAGHEWRRDGNLNGTVLDLALDADDRALAATYQGLSVRHPGEMGWAQWVHPDLGAAVTPWRVAPAPGPAASVWVTASHDSTHRVYRVSHDLAFWSDVTPDMPGWGQPSEVAVSASHPGRVAVATVDPATGMARVFITQDDGASWTASTPPGFVVNVSTLRWVGPRVFLGGVEGGIWRSTLWSSSDDGAHWQVPLVSASTQDFGMDVAGDPSQPDRLWAGTAEGLYHSTDGGLTWAGPSPDIGSPILRLEFDAVNGRLWAGVRESGTWVSSDGGDTWELRNHRLGAQPIVSLAANPRQPGELAAAVEGVIAVTGQVATTLDGGLEWAQDTAPYSNNIGAVRFGPSGDLYATLTGGQQGTLMRRGPDNDWQNLGVAWGENEYFAPGHLGFGASEETLLVSAQVYNFDTQVWRTRLWRSGDAGLTWQQVLEAEGYNDFTGIERTVGAGGSRLFVFEHSYSSQSPSRLWRSSDDGVTWSNVIDTMAPGFNGQICAGDDGTVLMQLTAPDTLFPQLFRSDNAGDSWVQTTWTPGYVEGMPFTAMHCPGDARKVFLGGYLGRLWMWNDQDESFVSLSDGSVWGNTWVRSILLTPSGLYVGHLDGVWANTDITLPWAGPSGLTVERTQARMRHRVTLQWQGGAGQVEIRKNGSVVATVQNTGAWSDGVLASRQAPTWQVCNAGSAECSAVVDGN